MYPFIRMAKEFYVHRKAADLPVTGTHVSHHICWPLDIDMWLEMNNGRAFPLYDLGRLVLAKRTGLIALMKREKWVLTVAGSTIRYRKRVRAFHKITMKSRCVGWDDKFFYIEQSMWRRGECTSHVMIRMAATDRNGLVRTDRVIAAFGPTGPQPELPEWVQSWIKAEAQRPWPPMQDA